MDKLLEKLRPRLKKWGFKKLAFTACAFLLIYVAVLCISIVMQMHIHHEYAEAAEYAREQVYQHLIDMEELFSHVDNEEVDVHYKLIPELKNEFSVVKALNDMLQTKFDGEKPVLDAEQIAAIDAAFEEYAEAYRIGDDTGLARDDMADALAPAQAMIEKRYKVVDPNTENVIVIDGNP